MWQTSHLFRKIFMVISSFQSAGIRGLYPIRGRTCYRQISWTLEDARLDVIMIVSFWILTGIAAAVLPRCLPNFRADFKDFTRSCSKTSVRLVDRGPGVSCYRTLGAESILHSLAADDNFVYANVWCHKRLRLVIYVVFQMKYIIKLEDFLCCQNNLNLNRHVAVIFHFAAEIM